VVGIVPAERGDGGIDELLIGLIEKRAAALRVIAGGEEFLQLTL